jgi:hypothetical protein
MHEQEKQSSTNNKTIAYRDTQDPTVFATEPAETTYPPQDGGKGAWMFLFGACIIEVTAWGNHIFMRLSDDYSLLTFEQDFLTAMGYSRHTSTATPHSRVKISSLQVVCCPMAFCNCRCLLSCTMLTISPSIASQ